MTVGTIDIRTVAEDCSDLLALRRSWHPDDDESYDERFRTWWERERQYRRAVVAYDDAGAAAGMANAQIFSRMPAPGRADARWLYVANVYVVEHHRRRGIGRALMEALTDLAKANGMVRMVLAPSEMSIPMYESLGFRPADDLMRLDLEP